MGQPHLFCLGHLEDWHKEQKLIKNNETRFLADLILL